MGGKGSDILGNEEFQKIVLEQFGQINGRLDKMDTRLTTLEKGQKKLQQDVTLIKRDVKGVWEDIIRLDKRVEKQKEEIELLKG